MKLLSAYIENFGKICKQDILFNENLTSFCYENGYGKTTIATFIRVMFYGMASYKTSSKFNDREHYFPFDGGKYGGNLTFENDGKIYKIVRFFDKKSEVRDEVTLYENDVQIPLVESLGKWVFGVDEASFSRTLYFDEPSAISKTSSDVTFKLTGIVEGEDEDGFENAVANLDKALKKLKRTGRKGELFDIADKILNLKAEIENLKQIDASLEAKYEKRKELLSKLSVLEEELKRVSAQKIKENDFLTYEGYLADAHKVKSQIEQVKQDYEQGFPTAGEISELLACVEKIAELNAKKPLVDIANSDLNKLESLRVAFAGGVPSDSDLEAVKADINHHNDLKNSKKQPNFPLLIMGVAEIAVSIVLVLLSMYWGLIFTGLGITFILLSFIVNGKSQGSSDEALKKAKGYLEKFGVFNPNLLEGVYELKSKKSEYERLLGEIAKKSDQLKGINEELNASKSFINGVLTKYKIIPAVNIKEQINGIASDVSFIRQKELDYKTLIQRAESFKAEKSLDKKPENFSNYDDVKNKINELIEEIKGVEREIKNAEDDVEALLDKQNELSSLIEEQEELNKRYKILTLTLEYLQKSEESLKARYINPVKNTFVAYADKLLKVLGEKVIMDKNFELYFERSGENKSREYLSAGQKVLCDMCLRLALLDNMYGSNSPFIILDDPFITLDEANLKKALELLKELANDRQIVYFTCHSDRRPLAPTIE